MGGMPYHLEKGPIFARLEAKYNGDRALLHQFLEALWLGQPLGDHGVLTSPMYPAPNPSVANAIPAQRKTSMLTHWFGDVGGSPQPAFGSSHPVTGKVVRHTGYWAHYYGDVRAIVKDTLLRAGEVALGYERPNVGDPLPPGTRHWPVEFFWKCGQPRFEGWVTWRAHPAQNVGQVNVIFATPATPDPVLDQPSKGGTTPSAVHLTQPQGMWVTSHSSHHQHRVVTYAPSPSGAWLVPESTVMYTHGVDPVGTWSPDFGMGGAPPIAEAFVKGA